MYPADFRNVHHLIATPVLKKQVQTIKTMHLALKRCRRPRWHTTAMIKCKGTTGAVKGVHDLLTLAMYHTMKSIRQFGKPTALSRVWGSKCGGAQASEQDFEQNIDQN